MTQTRTAKNCVMHSNRDEQVDQFRFVCYTSSNLYFTLNVPKIVSSTKCQYLCAVDCNQGRIQRRPRGPWPLWPCKNKSWKRWPHRFHVSRPLSAARSATGNAGRFKGSELIEEICWFVLLWVCEVNARPTMDFCTFWWLVVVVFGFLT